MAQTNERSLSYQVTHWNRHAAAWRNICAPLRPTNEDVSHLRDRVARWAALRIEQPLPLRGLLLGVTPEIAVVDWTPELHLLAIDQSQGMIDGVWPGDTAQRQATRGDWFNMHVAAGSFDLAIGDGALNALEFPDGYRRLATSLARAIRLDGLLALRTFCRPARDEPVDAVFSDAAAGAIGNFHIFKWRLVMALQGQDAARGVTLGDVWTVFHQRVSDIAAWAADRGWPFDEVSSIESYRGSAGVYSFPSFEETALVLGDAFELVQRWHGDYEMADRCPHLWLRRRAKAGE